MRQAIDAPPPAWPPLEQPAAETPVDDALYDSLSLAPLVQYAHDIHIR
jgi:hypothetical protein